MGWVQLHMVCAGKGFEPELQKGLLDLTVEKDHFFDLLDK